ncbi:MAG: hypothetical protein WC699_11640 [Bacteroidales bacterium]|jgi:hypothetical protein
MKKRILSISLLSFVLILSSCQKIKDLLTVKVDTDFTVNLPVTIGTSPLKSTLGTFNSTETFDPLSNADLATYKENIKGFDLNSMTGTVSELSEEVTLTDATLVVSTSLNSTQWHFTNLQITNGTVIQFDDAAGQWTKVNDILEEQTEITVNLSGTANKTNVTFTLAVTLGVQVSAKI